MGNVTSWLFYEKLFIFLISTIKSAQWQQEKKRLFFPNVVIFTVFGMVRCLNSDGCTLWACTKFPSSKWNTNYSHNNR